MLGGSRRREAEKSGGGRSYEIVLHRVMCPKMHVNGCQKKIKKI
jgi:hypothetical protein